MKIDYVVKRSKRKSIVLQIKDSHTVLVKVPFDTTRETIECFMTEKRVWILKQLERCKKNVSKAEAMGVLSEKDLKDVKKLAEKLIPERVEHYAKIAGITYENITIRLQKSRWGSCSSDGNLNFNMLLALMPLEILDSVVVHELCHRHHMNHSKEFYDEVLSIYPEYRKCNKWLKDNGDAYFRRIEGLKDC